MQTQQLMQTRGYHALVQVIYELQQDGQYSDEEGEETNALAELLHAIESLVTHPSPPEGMVGGWISVDERLPAPDEPVLACNGKWIGVAAWMSGDYLEPLERWQDEHREFIEMMGPAVTHWMPHPPPPTTSAGSGKGE